MSATFQPSRVCSGAFWMRSIVPAASKTIAHGSSATSRRPEDLLVEGEGARGVGGRREGDALVLVEHGPILTVIGGSWRRRAR